MNRIYIYILRISTPPLSILLGVARGHPFKNLEDQSTFHLLSFKVVELFKMANFVQPRWAHNVETSGFG